MDITSDGGIPVLESFLYLVCLEMGELLEYVNQRGQKFITLQRRHANRIKEMTPG
jgi:hypothetical protein